MYHDLDAFVILALVEKFHGQKAMYKKAVEMFRGKIKCEPQVSQGFILKAIKKRDVRTFVYKIDAYIDDYLYYALPARDLGDDGALGMVFYEGVVHPIVVTYETEDDYWWAIENEHEIFTAANFWLVWEHRLTEGINAEYLMFATYGYSGMPRWWGIKNLGGPVPYKDLLYYPEEGEELAPTYTHNEIAAQHAAAKEVLNDDKAALP